MVIYHGRIRKESPNEQIQVTWERQKNPPKLPEELSIICQQVTHMARM